VGALKKQRSGRRVCSSNSQQKKMAKEKDLEKQIGGCMAGFFNIFDRPSLLSPNKRLSSSPVTSLSLFPSSPVPRGMQ